MNIYRLGSCRTDYLRFKNNINTNTPNGNFTHTTKEALQQINLLNNNLNITESDFPLAFQTFIKNKDTYIEQFKKADIILIEISSIKLVSDSKGIYYNIVELNKNYKHNYNNVNYTWFENESKLYYKKMSTDEIYNDIQLLKKKINKPIIFQGHINLLCDINSDRQIIDNALKNEKSIIYYNLCDRYELICAKKDNEQIDKNHLNEYGYELLYNKFMEILEL